VPSFEQLINTTKVVEVTDLINAIQAERRIGWRPVDGNENNLATINLGSDPAAGLIERVTNAFDAVLDYEWLKRGQPTSLMSPRAATAQWFNIPEGRLGNLAEFREEAFVTLIDRVQVTLQDSDREDRPTVDIRDNGIGIKPEEFASSILSLHKSRKLRKLFLAGAFGQGGSTALAYSMFTIVVSRPARIPHEIEDRSGEISFTIVRFNEGDPLTDKHGLYEYLIDHSTGHPIILPAPSNFDHGTLVRHVSMDIGKYKGILTVPTGSLWFVAHNYLFDPVLPFRLIEQRSGKNLARNELRLAIIACLQKVRIPNISVKQRLLFEAVRSS
jgi:hypothetical protein